MSLYDKASLVLIPSGTKAGTVFSQKPVPSTDVLTDDTLNNGDFEQASSGWTLQEGTVVFSNGNAEFQGSSIINQNVSGNAGETLVVTYTVESADANTRLQLYDGSWFDVEDSVGTHTVSFVSAGTFFYLRNNDSGNITLSSISAKKIVDGNFDFTRSTYATRVNSQGLIEKERSNLLTYSNTFDNVIWAGTATWTSGQVDKDGGNNAWTFAKSNPTNSDFYDGYFSGVQTFSIYVKKEVGKGIAIYNFNSGSTATAIWNIETGVKISQNAYVIDSNLVEYNSNWWRFDMSVNVTSGRWYIYATDGTSTLTADTLVLQDAQLEQGLVATDVIETTTSAVYTGITDNVPRLDYDGDCPSLLLEPQRTNEVEYSEHIDATATVVNSTVTVNEATSPDGFDSANKYTASTSFPNIRFTVSVSNTLKYTFSCFVKYDGYRYQYIRFNTGFDSATPKVWFDLVNGVVATEESGIDSSSIEDYGNGWYRIIATSTATSTDANGQIRLHMTDTDNSETIVGSTSLFNYIWGAQLEEGSYATSYIPTYGTSVTRNNDSATQNSSYTFGSGAFSLFLEHEPIPVGSGGQVVILRANPLDFYFRWTSDTVLNIWNQEIQQSVLNKAITGGRNQNIKICMVYDGVGSTDVYVNGVKERDGYSFTWPDGPYNIGLDSSVIINGDIPIHISQVMTFETALTNEEAIALTTV